MVRFSIANLYVKERKKMKGKLLTRTHNDGIMFYNCEQSNIMTHNIGVETVIHSHVWIGDKVTIGKRCKIQAFTFIPNGVTIQDDVFIGPHVCFTNDKYPPSHGKGWAETLVMKGASIGAGAVILSGLILGENCRIGAGAVVTKTVYPGATVKGNPAKQIFKEGK